MDLNEKQSEAYTKILNGKNVFITGPGGTGKSFLIHKFLKEHGDNTRILLTSTTGISAVNIGGTTIHSALGLGLGDKSIKRLKTNIKSNPSYLYKWQNTNILIIDEISMMHPDLFDKIEHLARLLRENNAPFGGLQIVLTGDFLQLPVVNSSKFCFESDSWKYIDNTIFLTEIIRQEDIKFQNCLNNIRVGNITNEVKEILNSRVEVKLKNDYGILPTCIYTTNKDVDFINEIELEKINEPNYVYEMEIANKIKIGNISKFCIASPKLTLCVGAQVMLIKNLDLNSGLANGSRGIVVRFTDDDLPVVKFLNGVECVVGYSDWRYGNSVSKPEIVIFQIPLKLAWCITVHKSQGLTLDLCELNLSNIFEYGQGYVALSRVKNLEGLNIINIDYDKLKAHPKALSYYNLTS